MKAGPNVLHDGNYVAHSVVLLVGDDGAGRVSKCPASLQSRKNVRRGYQETIVRTVER